MIDNTMPGHYRAQAMAAAFANLNLCWTHQGSPYMVEHMLNGWIDMVPSNKIIGFGGDVSAGPYKVYDAPCFARENIARALAVRIRRAR